MGGEIWNAKKLFGMQIISQIVTICPYLLFLCPIMGIHIDK